MESSQSLSCNPRLPIQRWGYAERMTGKTASNAATDAADDAENSTTLRSLARLGYAVNGLLHVLIGVIAITVAVGSGGGEADQSGALGQLASNPAGVVLLWVITIGLFALGLWQVIATVRVKKNDAAKTWGKRLSEFSKAVAYVVVGVTALTFALGGSKSSSGSSQSASASVLAAPGGVFALVAVGLVIFGIGIFFVVRGISRRFTQDLVLPGGGIGRTVVVLGAVGYIAKGIALAVVGGLFVVAAVTFDPSKASGLDGALKSLASLPFGAVILLVVGIGLIAYGAYLGARARWGTL